MTALFMPGPAEQLDAQPTSLEARLLDAVQQAVIATDMSGVVVFWNAYAERLFGWSAQEALGRSITELTPSDSSREEAEAIMARLRRGQSWAGEFPVRRKDGAQFTAFVVNSPIMGRGGALVGIVGISTDVSEQRAVELQVRQAAKMEAIGRLAGGIAHDFNSLLTVILGHVDLLQHNRGPRGEAEEWLRVVSDAASRAAALTQQLLVFSRQQRVWARAMDVGEGLQRILPLLRRLIGEDVDIQLELGGEALRTVIDPTQFDQLVLNLAVNARDAMPRGGVLRLRAVPVADDGAFLRLSVSDTGTGMTPHVAEHLFDPFFTTKAVGRGTGLGLATVHGIVQQAGGTISVVTEPGRGSTFHVVLPRTHDAVDPPARPVAAPGPAPRRTILVVEDEPALRSLIVRILAQAGYTVLAADCAESALRTAAAHTGPIDLLLSDIEMPGGSGIPMAAQLRALRPAIRVVLMTGYSEEDLLVRGLALTGAALLMKPFRSADLLAILSTS